MPCSCTRRPAPVRARVRLAGLGATSDGYTPQEVLENFASVEAALGSWRSSIILRQKELRALGKLDAAVSDFNRARSSYAQKLSYYVGMLRGQLEAYDQTTAASPIAYFRTDKAGEFDREMISRFGSKDPADLLIRTLPPIRASSGALSGLGAAQFAVVAAGISGMILSLGLAALMVGQAIKTSGINVWAPSVAIKEQAQREQQKILAIKDCQNNQACLDALAKVDTNKPPPDAFPWGTLALVGAVGAALVLFWPKISGAAGGYISRVNRGGSKTIVTPSATTA